MVKANEMPTLARKSELRHRHTPRVKTGHRYRMSAREPPGHQGGMGLHAWHDSSPFGGFECGWTGRRRGLRRRNRHGNMQCVQEAMRADE